MRRFLKDNKITINKFEVLLRKFMINYYKKVSIKVIPI